MAQSEAEVTAELTERKPPSDSAEASGAYGLRAERSWNRLNKAATVSLPRKLKKAEAARRRTAKLR